MTYDKPKVTIDLDEYLALKKEKTVDAGKENILKVGGECVLQLGNYGADSFLKVKLQSFKQDETSATFYFNGTQAFILQVKK